MFSYCWNVLFLTFSLQIMSLWAISKSGYSLLCPVQSHWKHRANILCNSSDSYVCVYDQNERNFREFCHNKAIIENKGYKVIFRGAIDGEPCERNFYQPFKFNSSGNSGCVYKKSVCTEEGQVIYKNGNSQTDNLCRCDDSKGYAFIHRPQHRCYCVPSKEDCSCYFKKCSPDEFLAQDYDCLNLRTWERNVECSTVIIDGMEQTSTVIPTGGYFDKKGTTDRSTWIALIVTVLVLVFIGVVFAYTFGIKQLHKRRDGVHIIETPYTTPQDGFDLQDSIELLKWKKMNEHFEETHASKTVLNTVKTHGFVVISGPPGSGKSAIAYNTAFKLEKNEEFKIVSVSSPEDIRKYLMPKSKQLFVIDDPVGKYTVDETSIRRWKNEEVFVKQIFINCLNTKLILTCRSYIYKSGFHCKLNFSPVHCDLLSHTLKMTVLERVNISQKYDIPDLHEETIMMYDFFPLLCALYSTNEDLIMYFTNPYKVLTEEMMNIKETSDIAFLAIALLVVLDNNIDRKIFSLENTEIKELLNDLCNECGFTFFPSITLMLSALYCLIGTYVKETDNGFACIHDVFFQNLSYIVGTDIIHCLFKYGSSKFLANRLQLASLPTVHDELTIMVQPEQEEQYFERLMLDIRKGYHSHVFTGIQMEYIRFRSKLETFLKRLKAEDLTCDKNNSTPLHVVSEKGYDDLIFELFNLQKDQINHQDDSKRTPLFMACLGCHDKVIQTLLAIDSSSLHVANKEYLTPFDVALNNDDVSTMKILLKYDAKINRKDKTTKRTALQRACDKGSYNAVKFLLSMNADVKHKDANGLKAIHIACSKGHLNIVEVILKHDKSMINEIDTHGRTPLFTSCERDQEDIVLMLLDNKANVNQSSLNGTSPLHKACKIGNESIVRKLLEYSAKVNVQSENDLTPLHIACSNGNVVIVEMLLHKKAEVNISSKQGWTPFLISCSKGCLEICKLLLARGVNINAVDKSLSTSLHVACRGKQEHIVRFLINHGGNINAVNTKKETPLYIACLKECYELVELLIINRADVNICEEEGNSPLHAVCIKGNKQIVELLLDQKADTHKRNEAGNTPCDVVHGDEHDVIVDMINRYKAK